MTEALPLAPDVDQPFVAGDLVKRSEPVEGVVVLTYRTQLWHNRHHQTRVFGRSGHAGPARVATSEQAALMLHGRVVAEVQTEYFDILRRAQSSWRTRFAARVLAAAAREHLAEHDLPAGRRDVVLGLLVDAVRGAR